MTSKRPSPRSPRRCRSLHAAGNLVDELDSTVVLADMWVAAGRPGRARGLYEQALRTATGNGEPYPRATADLHVGLAELDRELDDLASAEAHLETARVLAERASITENRHRWPVVMAQVRAARGDHDGRSGPARRGRGALPARLLPRRTPDRGDEGPAPDRRRRPGRRQRAGPMNADSASTTTRTTCTSTSTSPWLGCSWRHSTDGGATPRAVASGCSTGCTARRRKRREDGSLLEIRMLQALAHHAGGDRAGGARRPGPALSDAPEPDGHVRLYLDEGAPMLDLLHDAAESPPTPGECGRWARRLLAAASTTDEAPVEPQPPGRPAEPARARGAPAPGLRADRTADRR